MTPTQIAAIKGMLAYFDSGNNIPVDKAVIKGNCAEVAALRAALAETAPVQEPVYAFRRKGLDDFCTCSKERFDELSNKPHLFETTIFYAAPQAQHPSPTQRAAIEKAAELFSRQVLGISAWGMTEAHEMAEALRAALAEPAPVQSDGWLQDGSLLYRLTAEKRPQNRDEINVTMADGSRTAEARTRRAGELLDRIRQRPAPPADVPMLTDEELREAFAQNLSDTYVCSRVWIAWSYGTMSEDDFSPASECDELLDSLVKAVRQKAGLP